MPNIISGNKLKVTTIRYGVTDPQVADFIDNYQKEPRQAKRIDVAEFLRTGRSRTFCVDLGMQIETIIELQAMTDSDVARTR